RQPDGDGPGGDGRGAGHRRRLGRRGRLGRRRRRRRRRRRGRLGRWGGRGRVGAPPLARRAGRRVHRTRAPRFVSWPVQSSVEDRRTRTRGAAMTIRAVNPATGKTIEEYQETPPEEVDRILHAADAAFQKWRRTSVQQRAAHLREAARLLRERAPEYARLMALEMGKPVG